MTVDIYWNDTMYVVSWYVILVLGSILLSLVLAIAILVGWLLRRTRDA